MATLWMVGPWFVTAWRGGVTAPFSHNRIYGLVGTDSSWQEPTRRVITADPRSASGQIRRNEAESDVARLDSLLTRAVSSDQRNIAFGWDDPTREVTDEQTAQMAQVDQGGTDRDPPPGGER